MFYEGHYKFAGLIYLQVIIKISLRLQLLVLGDQIIRYLLGTVTYVAPCLLAGKISSVCKFLGICSVKAVVYNLADVLEVVLGEKSSDLGKDSISPKLLLVP